MSTKTKVCKHKHKKVADAYKCPMCKEVLDAMRHPPKRKAKKEKE